MPYNREELSNVGFKLKKIRRDIDSLEKLFGKEETIDASQFDAYMRLKEQRALLEESFTKILAKGIRER